MNHKFTMKLYFPNTWSILNEIGFGRSQNRKRDWVMPSHLVVCNIGLHPSLAFDIGYLGDPTTWTLLKMVPREGTVKRKLFVYQQDHTLIQMQDLWESKSAHFHKHLFVLSSSTLYLRARQNPSVRSFPSVAFETVPVLVCLTTALSRSSHQGRPSGASSLNLFVM